MANATRIPKRSSWPIDRPGKPCPRCYDPMVREKGAWRCHKHGLWTNEGTRAAAG